MNDIVDDDLEAMMKRRVMDGFCRQIAHMKQDYDALFINRLVVETLRYLAERRPGKRAAIARRIHGVVLDAPDCEAFMASPYASVLFDVLRRNGHGLKPH